MPVDSLISWFFKKRVHQIELFKKYPIEVQEEQLFNLLDKAKNTEWGKKYHYAEIKSVAEYQQRFPVQDYEGVKPYVERLKNGEQNLLWHSQINWFAKSSGTTHDKSKFIPISKEALEDCHYRGGKDLLALYFHYHPKSNLYRGKNLVVGGSSELNYFRKDSKNSYWGDLSAIIINNLPFWVELKRTPKKEIALMNQWEEKIEKMALSTMDENVTIVAGVPSWTLILLRRIVEIKGASNLLEVWPELQLYMHGGVSFIPYKEQFEQLIPKPDMHYLETYNASEGNFGIQDEVGKDMLLMLDYGIFYEFIPSEEFGKKEPKTILLDEVELGKNYALVISTNTGLWRYFMGDTIKFTEKYPFRFKITGRTKHFMNAFGEEVIIDNAEQALKVACEKTNAQIKEYTAAPIFMKKDQQGGHEWLIEFEKPPKNIEFFAELLDNALKSINSDYEAKRSNSKALKLPVVHSAKKGTFYSWLKDKNKLGGQHKVPRLSNDRRFMDEIMKFNF